MNQIDSESTLAAQLPVTTKLSGPESTLGVKKIDYRVSRVAILCKDCGYDVGFYPARHVCQVPTSDQSLQQLHAPKVANTWTQWLSTLTAGTHQALSYTHTPPSSCRPHDRSKASNVQVHPETSPKWIGMWNKLKASVQTKSKSENQASDAPVPPPPPPNVTTTAATPSSLRDYYVTKDGPVPDILKPRATVRPDDATLQKFEQQHHVSLERIKSRQIPQHG